MKREWKLRWAYVFIAFFVGLMALGPVVSAEGPVHVQVDKSADTPNVDQPVFAPAPDWNQNEFRLVQAPTKAPTGFWAKLKSFAYNATNSTVKWATGSDLKAWSDPRQLWDNAKKFGRNIVSGTLEVLTGANLDKWKDIQNWTWKDWLVVGVNIALTLIPIGKAASAGLRLASKAGRPLVARVAEKAGGKVVGDVFAKAGSGVAKLLGKIPGKGRLVTAVKDAAAIGKRSRLVQRVSKYASKTYEAVRTWQANKGFRSLVGYTKFDTRNPLIKRALDKSRSRNLWNWPRKALLNSRPFKWLSSTPVGKWTGRHLAPVVNDSGFQVWHVREAVVKRNPVGMLLKSFESWTKRGVALNAKMATKGKPLVREMHAAKRDAWQALGGLAVSLRERHAARSLAKFASGSAQSLRDQIVPILSNSEGSVGDSSTGTSREEGKRVVDTP